MNYITKYQIGGGTDFDQATSSRLFKVPKIGDSNSDQNFNQDFSGSKPSSGINTSGLLGGIFGGLGSAYKSFDAAQQLPSGAQKSAATGDAVEGAISSTLGMLGPWGAVAGAALNLVNGVGGSLMNHNATARAANKFQLNDTVQKSASYGGITSGAQLAKQDGMAYRKAGLFGKLFTSPQGLQNEFSTSNTQQGLASNVLKTNQSRMDAGNASTEMQGMNLQNKDYNSQMWNNGSLTFGKKGTKLDPIHIKKSHEGKFTEYKKRTGETTEEAKHSSDPHVRKMATFAANAAKWKHMEGGIVGSETAGRKHYSRNLYKDYDYSRKHQQGGTLQPTPDPSMQHSPRYLDGYKTAWSSNQQSKTLDQDLQATMNYAGKGNLYWDNDTMDYYKGQINALQDLSNQRKHYTAPVTHVVAPKNGLKQDAPVVKQHGGKIGVPETSPRVMPGTGPTFGDKLQNTVTDTVDKPITRPQAITNSNVAKTDASVTPTMPALDISTDIMDMVSQAIGAPTQSAGQQVDPAQQAPVDAASLPGMQAGGTMSTSGSTGTLTYGQTKKKLGTPTKTYKGGGAVNVIADGELHARKHDLKELPHLEDAPITHKGIPVVSFNDTGEVTQHAEVEREELILHYDLTKQLEALAKEGTDEAAIKAGKLLAREIVKNTKDKTGVLEAIDG